MIATNSAMTMPFESAWATYELAQEAMIADALQSLQDISASNEKWGDKRHRIDDAAVKLGSLERQLISSQKTLEASRLIIHRQRTLLHNRMQPISTLPIELLHGIFLSNSLEDEDIDSACQTCHHWRGVLLKIPQIWARRVWKGGSSHLLDIWTSRAQRLPLQVEFNVRNILLALVPAWTKGLSDAPAWSTILDTAPRWETVTLTTGVTPGTQHAGDEWSLFPACCAHVAKSLLIPYPLPLLRRLALKYSDIPYTITFSLAGAHMPSLTSLHVCGIRIEDIASVGHQLTHLRMDSVMVNLEDFMTYLRMSTKLKTLELYDLAMVERTTGHDIITPPSDEILLPSLTNLNLGQDLSSLMKILPYCRFPVLRHLEVEEFWVPNTQTLVTYIVGASASALDGLVLYVDIDHMIQLLSPSNESHPSLSQLFPGLSSLALRIKAPFSYNEACHLLDMTKTGRLEEALDRFVNMRMASGAPRLNHLETPMIPVVRAKGLVERGVNNVRVTELNVKPLSSYDDAPNARIDTATL